MNRTTPKVEGSELAAAQTKLTGSGFTPKVVGSGETVVKQVPEAGKPIPKDGMVYLYTEESAYTASASVPDFKGKTVAQAKQAAASAGLNIQLDGAGLDSGEAQASGQSLEAGTKVPPGTVVTVTFIEHNNIG